MDFDHGIGPGDVPAPPPTPDEVAAAFPVPLLTFDGQPALEEAAASRSGETSNGVMVMAAAMFSYMVWRNPADREDPMNLAELPDDVRAQLDFDPPWTLPDWLMQWRARMRYPMLWDALRTTWTSSAEARRSVETLAVEHLDYIVMNQFRNAAGQVRPAGMMPQVGLPAGELYAEDFFPGGLIPAGLLGPAVGGGINRGSASRSTVFPSPACASTPIPTWWGWVSTWGTRSSLWPWPGNGCRCSGWNSPPGAGQSPDLFRPNFAKKFDSGPKES